VKDALTSSNLYTMIDEMLMRAYYLYEKSPKKCHELDEVVHCSFSEAVSGRR